MPSLLATEADITYRGGGLASRPQLVQLRLWNSYDVPATLRTAFSLFLCGCLVLSLHALFARAVLPILIPFCVMWVLWSSYDLRNIFVVLPILGIVAAYGGSRAWVLRPQRVWQSTVATFAGLFLILAGGGLLKDLQARGKALTGPDGLAARLEAIRGGPDPRIDFFFRQDAPDYHYVRALAARTRARHVLASSPIYRFFENGVYTMNLWPHGQITPGDLFVSHHEWHRPPDAPGWVFVHQGPSHRVWVFDPQIRETPAGAFRGASPNTDGAMPISTGEFDVAGDDLMRRGYVLWEAEIDAGSAPPDVAYEASGMRLEPTTTIVRETMKDGTTRISGVIIGQPEGTTPSARVRITISSKEKQPVVRAFRSTATVGVDPSSAGPRHSR
jgi:hypothetical protein